VSGIVFGAIAPHGPIAVREACTEAELDLAAATLAGFDELAQRCAAASPDILLIATPHSVHVDGALSVVVSARMEGAVAGTDGRTIMLDCEVDAGLAALALDGLLEAGISAVGVSFGGNRRAEAVVPMDWGTLIPLWHLGGRSDPRVRAVVVGPARDLPAETHVAAGRALADAAARSGKRIAFVASADHGHAHTPDGPYGFDDAAAEYDELVVQLVQDNRLHELHDIDPGLVERAAADSWWQLLMLHGALGTGWRSELLSYEAPSYYGMLCAAFTPDPLRASPAAGSAGHAPSRPPLRRPRVTRALRGSSAPRAAGSGQPRGRRPAS
jgi:aromatic ring-opening dioxygenase LigB subunit